MFESNQNPRLSKVQRKIPWSGVVHERTINVDVVAFDEWKTAFEAKAEDVLSLQNAFPNISAGDREFLFSGITPEEWALDELNSTRSERGRPTVQNLDDYSDEELEDYFGITQRSRVVDDTAIPNVKMREGMIVFIKNEPEAHNRVYVNELEDAVRLSNRMRHAGDVVRVINNRDELYAEWVNGSPSDSQYDIPRLLGSYAEESYDYSNFEDVFDDDGNLVFANELPTRLHELSSMLQMAFDTALQQNDYNEYILAWQDHEEDPKMLGLIREALDLGERQPDWPHRKVCA